MAEKQQTEIDAGLLEELRERAHEQSRTENELLEEIVRSYLILAPRRSGSLNEFFERLERRRRDDGVEPLPEDEATRLANEELHALRLERRGAVARPEAWAVLDPSVLVSAALSDRGAPWEVLRRGMTGDFGLVVSPRLLHELQTVLAREKFRRHFTYEEATEYVSWLHHEAQVVRDPAEGVVVGAVDADPDDEYLVGLAGALEGTSYLVSVDRHLLDLPGGAVKDGEGRTLARILTPGELLRELDRMG